ncbi:MAG: type I restriction endonuclease subunit M [Candidatus Thermofonsia Clade 1 bacterium]|uniref:site-specific DNA-methyltransferase (adenine-specific) n=1 Tax=Candidatus Thermofonsia Clade 1 bacterium TaxID=2364210 RepID=A0A2M8NZ93_9CHLR|nr:MAG: type I restriction endonuclease subunit M [Candidatus Thermofonsia Clade 1 bacterium]
MIASISPNSIQAQLESLSSLDKLRDFFVTLNYPCADETLLSASVAGALDQPRIIAKSGDFKIIYTRLERLSRTLERDIISKLLPDHPYALFVFSDPTYTAWHLVNVKLSYREQDAHLRRIFRRITVSPEERLRTASERLAMIDLSRLPSSEQDSALAIQDLHDKAFDVEAVTQEFFRAYRRHFEGAEQQICGLNGDQRRTFTQRLFNRLMFILFLERKGFLKLPDQQGRDYLRALWDRHKAEDRDDFYTARLKPLFAAGLNTPNEVNIVGINSKGAVQLLIGNVPYLNGGLFEEHADEQSQALRVPDSAFVGSNGNVFQDLFYRYNFTVDESTPFDVEVAVDPEMLGKIFEELVTGRHESGSYYTPKTVSSFMCRAALRSYLQRACQESDAALDAFIHEGDTSMLRTPESVLDALRSVRICDPACGSGAYLLGMMQELLRLRRILFDKHQIDSISVYNRKLQIIQSNLYGVDSDEFAVNIARLRLWLSLAVEYTGDAPPPLPNLDYKIEIGDSLTAPAPILPPNGNLHFRERLIEDFNAAKAAFLVAHGNEKIAAREKTDRARQDIRDWLRTNVEIPEDAFDWAVEFAEVFKEEGFDIVIANPPYIRHELIATKGALRSTFGVRFTGSADLYVYFYFRALELLKPNGTLCFISSNKWLRAAYGEKLRAELAQNVQIQHLIDFGDLPVFGATAYPMIFTARKAPPAPAHAFRALPVRDLEVLDRLPAALRAQGFDQPQASLSKEGWTLAEPGILALLEKLRQGGTPLGDYVKGAIYRGVVTGYNEAFVIDRATRDRLIAEDPKSEEVIKPLLRGRDIKRWQINFAEKYLIFTRRGIKIDEYPAIERHLLQYKARLVPDGKGGRKVGSYMWYEIQNTIAYYAEFEKPKIVWGNLATKPQFALDTQRFYVNSPAKILVAHPDDLPYLVGILNSNVSHCLIAHMAAERQDGFVEYMSIYVAQVPIPNAPQALRALIGAVARRLTELGGRGSEVTDLEAQLNDLVYQAYGLSASESGLIEAYVNGKAAEA